MTNTASAVRVRFAPSPTGYLHIGGARTVLFNWLVARKAGGKLILRIEDTDRTRHVEDSVQKILDDLRWLGLDWDEGPEAGGDYGPYFQSERLGIYDRYLQQLLEAGDAYYALESREELQSMRERARAEKRVRTYVRPDPLPTIEQGLAARAEGKPVVVRFKMPDTEITVVDDILGPVTLAAEQLEDFVIQKSDGYPTYHFACVVDDELMKISHVLRGQEHLMNTPKHMAIQRALGFATPRFAHLPVIFNMDGSKMSKRDKHKVPRTAANDFIRKGQWTVSDVAYQAGCDPTVADKWLKGADDELQLWQVNSIILQAGVRAEIDVHDFRVAGYLPEAVLNFISLLGWSPGEDRERFDLDEMLSLFSVERVGKTNARFDREKLLSFNTDWAGLVSSDRLLAAFRDYLAADPDITAVSKFSGLSSPSVVNQADDAMLAHVLRACAGFRTFPDAIKKAGFVFAPDDAINYDPKAVKKVLAKGDGAGYAMLEYLRPKLRAVSDWSSDPLEVLVQEACDDNETKMGGVAQPIRVAVSGTTISPAIGETLVLLGRDRTLARIERCLTLRN